MIDKNFFTTIKILDGGMGQELLSRGLQSKGSLWSASALLEERYNQLVIDAHLDFINAGANVIVTNNFSARRVRMIENNVKNFVEIGPGKVLSGLIKRINKEVKVQSINSEEDINNLII